MPVKQLRPIYQIKINLIGVKPAIWRRVLVPSSINLLQLHDVIQITMGWTNSHLHQFISGETTYGILSEFDDSWFESKDERKYKLAQLLKREKDSLKYEYDFGDGWEHKIVLEKILSYDVSTKVPSCIKGKRDCPPEDCGGVCGYADLIEIIQEPSHPEREEMLEWVGGEFDPEYFDIKETNAILERYCT